MAGDGEANDVRRSGPHVTFHGEAVLHLPGGTVEQVTVDLVAGRDRYSVGGEVAESPRWWRGRLEWTSIAEHATRTEVTIELDDGRSAIAMIEPDPAGPDETVLVRGIGPPPFDVP